MYARQKTGSIRLFAMLFCVLCASSTSVALAQFGAGPNGNHPGGNHPGDNHSGGQGHHPSNKHPGHHHNHHHNGHNNGFNNTWLYGRGIPFSPQNYNYGYYSRPYPYHLDYYRMRYQGSYEPYAGNLYGPPLVQAPTYVNPPYEAPQVNPPYVPVAQPFPVSSPYAPQANPVMRNYAGAYYW
jgi:hypothetical protein